jgi:transposase
MLSLCGYSKENPPPQTSPKTINVSLLMQYILSRCLYFVKFPQGFCGPLKRQIKWDTYINKPRILNNFIEHTLLQVGFPVKQKLKRKNRIFKKATHPCNPKKKRKSQAKAKKRKQKSVRKSRKRRFGELKTPTLSDSVVPVFAYGNAKFDSTMATSEGDMASCNSFAAKVMQTKQNIQTIFVSEYRTTKDCHMCGFEADPISETYENKEGKLKNRSAWYGKRCSGNKTIENENIWFHKPVHLHRDGNAALNIKGKLMDLLN